jgi:hypothetical protein
MVDGFDARLVSWFAARPAAIEKRRAVSEGDQWNCGRPAPSMTTCASIIAVLVSATKKGPHEKNARDPIA